LCKKRYWQIKVLPVGQNFPGEFQGTYAEASEHAQPLQRVSSV
jgi:hypothetical protein